MAMNKQTKYGHPEGYDYLKDVRDFGDAIMLDFKRYKHRISHIKIAFLYTTIEEKQEDWLI